MSLKIGDKVKMTKKGFKFYSDLNIQFDMISKYGVLKEKDFVGATCELFAIHGVGVVKKFNTEGDPYIKWEYRLDGIRYYYNFYYEADNVKKLSLLDKIKFKLQGRI